MRTNSISQSVCNYHSEGEHQKLIRKLHKKRRNKLSRPEKRFGSPLAASNYLVSIISAAISSSQEAGIFP